MVLSCKCLNHKEERPISSNNTMDLLIMILIMLSSVKGAVSYRFSQRLLTLMCNNSKFKADINFFFFSVA